MPQSIVTKRILFVYNTASPFVFLDRDLLQQKWEICELYQQTRRINFINLIQAVHQCNLIFCWFASWHSLMPVLLAKLLRKPSIVVVGGYDTANLSEADYGSQRGGLRRLIARTVIFNASHLITNSYSAKMEAIENAGAYPQKIHVIHHGLQDIPIGSLSNRDQLVITVSNVWRENLLRKGLLPFVQAASFLPDIKFMLIGKWYDNSIETLRQSAPPNVEFTGFVSDERLIELYQHASVYVQASLHEGFGMSVAESMLAGCIPVVTRKGSLPEVVGDAGIYTDSAKPREIAEAIRQGLAMDSAKRNQARERIVTNFSLERRKNQLFSLINQFL